MKGTPKSVCVGVVEYEIRFIEPDDSGISEQKNDGTVDFNKKIINLAGNQQPAEMADSFLHEIGHILWHDTGLETVKHESELTEEIVVRLTASGLTRFWQDNQKAMKWWAGLLV